MISIRKKEGDVTSYLSEDNKKLRDMVSQLKRELDMMKEPPLLVCDVLKVVDKKAIVRLPNGSHFFVNVSPLLITLAGFLIYNRPMHDLYLAYSGRRSNAASERSRGVRPNESSRDGERQNRRNCLDPPTRSTARRVGGYTVDDII